MKFIVGGCIGVLLLVLSSCRSTKSVVTPGGGAGGLSEEWVDKMAATGLKEGTVTSKMNLDLNLNGKSLSAGGTCSLKRNEVIQLSLVALGFMEVGRLEFTPQYMMMINRIGRQYVKVNYADVPYLKQAGVDFYTLQSLFWNDLFVPGKDGQWSEDDFDVSKDQENTVFTTRSGGLLQCRFVVDLLTGLIRSTSVSVPGQPSVPPLNWTYQHFANVEQKSSPDKMQLSVSGAGKDLTAQFTLSNPKWNAKNVELTPEPGGKYEKVSPDVILKQLVK
ncbi:MAG: DUF4292 domain-containing protein [Paraprevotella sp.]|nr:DUF4292 domain-containing protein [Paraprevotella sp.]